MVKNKKQSNVKKYFEIKVENKWEDINYFFFLMESLYNNILPFFIGYIIGNYNFIWIIFLMIIPIYLNLSIEKRKERKKRIYVK